MQSFTDGCKRRCWSRARFDVTVCGGITTARKFFAVAEAHGLRTEVQSWGHTLTAAANLHVMLGLGGDLGSTHFELAVPKEIYEVGMLDTIESTPLSDVEGGGGGVHGGVALGEPVVRAPNSEGLGGLGVRVDWAAMDKLAFYNERISTSDRPGAALQAREAVGSPDITSRL